MSSSTFEELRTRHTADRDAALPRYMGQLQWSGAQFRTEREQRMRVLLATAKARSPWHRERLRDVDAATFTEADLPSLPTMSKADLMDNFDAVVTDPRLTRDIATSTWSICPRTSTCSSATSSSRPVARADAGASSCTTGRRSSPSTVRSPAG